MVPENAGGATRTPGDASAQVRSDAQFCSRAGVVAGWSFWLFCRF
jgi:hypothetical protein